MGKNGNSIDVNVEGEDHRVDLGTEGANSFHSSGNIGAYRDVAVFDSKAIHIYVLLQKQLERMTHYSIEKYDNSIKAALQDYVNRLYAIIDSRTYGYAISTVKESSITTLNKLKVEIEESVAVRKLNILIQNKKVLDFRNSVDYTLKEIISKFQQVYEQVIQNGKATNIWKRKLEDFDKEIVLHSNRDILKTLKEKDNTIESLKKQSEADLKKCSQDKEKFYQDKYKNDMAKVVADAKCKVENVQKELEFTHTYNAKEKQEARKEIQELTFKLEDVQSQNRRLVKQLEINNRKVEESATVTNRDSIESFEDEATILDCSNDEMISKLLQDESLKVINLKIKNFNAVKDKTIETLKNFVDSKITKDGESVKIESEGDVKYGILNHIKFFEGLLKSISKYASFQGFDIDNQSLVNIIESSVKIEKLSFKNGIIDVDQSIKIHEAIEFNISELESIGISPKKEKESKAYAHNLICALTKSTIASSLKQVTLSQSNSFGSSLWESIKSEFKDQVETVITKDPWLFNDIS